VFFVEIGFILLERVLVRLFGMWLMMLALFDCRVVIRVAMLGMLWKISVFVLGLLF